LLLLLSEDLELYACPSTIRVCGIVSLDAIEIVLLDPRAFSFETRLTKSAAVSLELVPYWRTG